MYFVFDETQRLAGPLSPAIGDRLIGYNTVVEGYQWTPDNSAEVDKGWILRANTIRELAELLGLPAEEFLF